ncbi:hypothetical protein TBR22_A15310 [Luteitalea sp. TBR-22]|uniref:hypothetical protein n=1 Tax=Luteitalea sp. TBR-22 TaxID=2802971 RepID=UPI001AF97BB8|nr:hypothetical protein [Luteitalea sp. TBR-22]BCS32321.1 hypothetical protein TBR22_A15310 [Luteitalea sp. TBR-22]
MNGGFETTDAAATWPQAQALDVRAPLGAAPTVGSAWSAAGVAMLAGLAATCALAPVQLSMTVVVAAAGLHNWCEARYLLSRMPARWGPLRPWFVAALTGTVGLAAAHVLIGLAPGTGDQATMRLSWWHTALVGWVVGLWACRRPGRVEVPQWLPAAFACVGLAWLAPRWMSLGLVYVHPLLALVFVDRELAVRRSPWLHAWRRTLGALPGALLLVWTLTTLLPTTADASTTVPQAGAFLLPAGLAAPLVATHVLLESLHYVAWIVLLPLASGARPWHLRQVPLALASAGARRVLVGVLVGGALAVGLLWIAFAWDYETTRDVYFTVAVLHVIAEAPFLVRLPWAVR